MANFLSPFMLAYSEMAVPITDPFYGMLGAQEVNWSIWRETASISSSPP